MDYDVGDGFLSIQETYTCKYEVYYTNWLSRPSLWELQHQTLSITFDRGSGTIPDTLIILDNVGNVVYELTVDDGATGSLCVPWPLVG